MTKKVKKAIITAAGLGTRFLPATKNLPKEMLPVVDKPIIHYIVEECVEAGIEDIIIVIRPGNESVMNYFTRSKALEKQLAEAGKEKQLERYQEMVSQANFIFLHQKPDLPYGNGSPILSAKHLVQDGPFVICWGDDLVVTPAGVSGAVKQVTDFYEKQPDADGVLAVTEVSKAEISKLGIVEVKDGSKEGIISTIIEKPTPQQTTSNLAEFGRMILPPEIFDYLTPEKTGKDGELWLMDSIHALLKSKQIYAKLINGEFLTTGDPFKFLKASLKFALQRDDLREDLLGLMKQLTSK